MVQLSQNGEEYIELTNMYRISQSRNTYILDGPETIVGPAMSQIGGYVYVLTMKPDLGFKSGTRF